VDLAREEADLHGGAALPIPTASLARRRSRLSGEVGPRALAIAAVVLIWWAASLAFPKIIPSPDATALRTVQIVVGGTFLFNMGQTLGRVLLGFAGAFAAALVVGVVMGTSRLGEKLLDFFVIIGVTIPGLIWAFIAIMLFGLSPAGPVFAVAVGTAPMLAINIWQGVKSVDRDLIDMATVFRADARSKLREVVLPHLGPHLLAATRYGLGLAWKIVVVVEMFGASNGVGFQLQSAYEGYDMTSVLAWTLSFVAVMMIIEYGILSVVERRVTRWRPRAQVWRR
jgi:NitT/TauT family transport system permease protein